ncbi:MAG TPA: hypothetical protein VNT75_02680 [Symbiobacteriaceae bacterium]|nr:hypothetical protein [Symbiobacteriaceae bacterium]
METQVGPHRVRAPRWSEWQQALSAAGSGPAQMLGRLLTACAGLTAAEADALPAATGDALLAAIFDLIEASREALGLERRALPDGTHITGHGVDLLLRPWSFGERNAALERALIPVGDGVALDLPVFELAMVLACALPAGHGLTATEVAGWPVPLGEAVIAALDELNGISPGREQLLAACVRSGTRHPDLDLLDLCLAFGWTPAQAEEVPARQAERLLAALGARRALEPAVAAPAAQAAPAAMSGEVTRIVITDR